MEFNVYNKCRVCLSADEQMHNLFDAFDQGITLRDILANTTKFEVDKDDGLSPYICQNCSTIIVDFYNLKTIYEENESQIRALLASCESQLSENEPQDEPDVITIKVEESAAPPEPQFEEVDTFTCPECGESFPDKNAVQSHLVFTHNITVIDFDEISEVSLLKITSEKTPSEYKCKICGEIFESGEPYQQHLETHKKNVCDICGVGFTKKSYLKDHLEVHCPEKRHVCNYCNKAFKRRTVLVKHRRIHTNPRGHICEKCGKAFTDRGTLKTHNMLLHVRERNYVCLICGVKFPLKATLEKHIRRHQNKEREFFCTQCPLGYRDKSSLDRHVFVKHSGRSVKLTCDECGKQYTTMGNLSKHQRVCHRSDEKIE
ncbi:Zinc finger protein 41-like Protein [Tribolium castaneum]|uniref:Zinc finger protein 41-like Protein n=2 Tax=Tribolium castaneum TaxID=7070 RepID=D6X0S6_TRICA|nr:PREDICTED: gastrula zinc finger protein XlCGF26.1 [Tribolium castaneum]EFA09562.1 Zinc finger protein 41-like Protein [Tribolium castaneum]|eukprot:XP_972396.3 PREDICTED: gastrula zinc finger protein XlCGF26.1 [Tribolium castaneum]